MAIRGDMYEQGSWNGVVVDVKETGHVLLAFAPTPGSYPRPNEWVDPSKWRYTGNAISPRRNQVSE